VPGYGQKLLFAATASRQEWLIDGGWTIRQGGDNVLKGHGLRGFPLGNEFGENRRDLLFLLLSRRLCSRVTA
jgi:hypothetical protein